MNTSIKTIKADWDGEDTGELVEYVVEVCIDLELLPTLEVITCEYTNYMSATNKEGTRVVVWMQHKYSNYVVSIIIDK